MRISDWSSDVCSSDLLALIEKRLGEKWQILEYQITTYENESVVQAIHDALSKCRLQDGPLAYERQDGVTRMHISFCDTPTRHREFLEQLRKMSDVTDVRVLRRQAFISLIAVTRMRPAPSPIDGS